MSEWPYNTARWQHLRARQLAIEPLCRYCAELGRTTAATEVDHTIPVAQRRDLAFDPDNLASICKPCHSGMKQRWEKSGTRPGCGTDGVPLDANHPWRQS